MEEEDLKELMLKLVTFFDKYPTKGYLSDAVNFKFGVSVEMQTWIDETVSSIAIKSGVKKIARVKSQDFISQLGYLKNKNAMYFTLIKNACISLIYWFVVI